MQIQKDLAQLTLAELYKVSREQKTTHLPEGGVAAWRRATISVAERGEVGIGWTITVRGFFRLGSNAQHPDGAD